MKKFLIVLVALFIINVGCKKNIKEQQLCACSIAPYPYFALVLKDAKGQDLLNSKTAGFYAQGEIQLYYKDASGSNKQLAFSIRPPFSYSTSDQFTFYQLVSTELMPLVLNNKTDFYLKIKDQEPKELKLQLEKNKSKIEKVTLNNIEAVPETGKAATYINGSLFYITL